MSKKSIYIVSVIGCLFVVSPTFAQLTGPQVIELEMAKARAEKARNDAIVEKQRAAEKAQKAAPSPSPASGATKGKAASEKSKPEKAAPEKSKPEKAAPEKSRPEKAAPEKSRPEKAAPEKSRPEKAMPEKSKPEKSK